MSISTNTHVPYVVRNVVRDNWDLVPGKPIIDPTFVLIEDFIGHRIPDNLHNYLLFHQKGRSKNSKFSTVQNFASHATYDVTIKIRTFDRGGLISYYKHLSKVLDLKRERPSPLHTLMHRTSYTDESNKANKNFEIRLTVRLYSHHQTL